VSNSFKLFTHTPCTEISDPDKDGFYHVSTPKGIIKTRHIVHATNGWAAHLLPGMRSKIIPARGVMTAQRPWNGLGYSKAGPLSEGLWAGQRSFVFFPTSEPHCFDYLTQQLPRDVSPFPKPGHWVPASEGELMLGGGFAKSDSILTELGNSDDRKWNLQTGKYLTGALGSFFVGGNKEDEEKDRVKALWSGILGISCDGNPWVGRVPSQISGRSTPAWTKRTTRTSLRDNNNNNTIITPKDTYATVADDSASGLPSQPSKASDKLAPGGEWMAAGYTGEGMVHAWRSGEALAMMVLGLDEPNTNLEAMKTDATPAGIGEWFPDVFRVTEDRWKNTGIEDLIATFF
jgi:glycine/D-amino acid oxidase-like deaminating enzyme